MLASELIAALTEQMKIHGDLPVLFAEEDIGNMDLNEPTFDSDGAGNDCYLL